MNWWNELTQLQRIFASAAIPTTIIMVLQFILQLLGIANEQGGTDVDVDAVDVGGVDADTAMDFPDDYDIDISDSDSAFNDGLFEDDGIDAAEGHSGLRLFTLRGIVAFFAVGGWMGVAAIEWNLSSILAVILACTAGTLAMYFVAWTIYTFLRMQQSGSLKYENAVGKEGVVYLTIPAGGRGKVNVIVQDRLSEFSAQTNSERGIRTREKIKVVDFTPDGVLIVEPKNLSEKNEIL